MPDIPTIKSYFETGDIPTQTQFSALIDGMWKMDFADISTANAPSINAESQVIASPATDSQSVTPGFIGRCLWQGSGNLIGNGHYIGMVGWTDINAIGKIAALTFGLEGRVDVTNGTVTLAISSENLIGYNLGVISEWIGTDSNILSNSGTINLAKGFQAKITGNAGTIVDYVGYYFPDQSAITLTGSRHAFKNDDPAALVKSAAPISGPIGAELAPPASGGWQAGRYYTAPWISTLSPVAVTANLLYAVPVLVPHRTTAVRIGLTVTTGAAGNCRMGIMSGGIGGIPNALELDAGTFDTSTTGNKEIVIAKALEAGVHYIVAVFSGTPTINYHLAEPGQRYALFGSPDMTGTADFMIAASMTYGTLPNPNTLTWGRINTPYEPHLVLRA